MEPADQSALRIVAFLAAHGLSVADAVAQLAAVGVDPGVAQQACTDLSAGNVSQTGALVAMGFNP